MQTVEFKRGKPEPFKDLYQNFFPEANFDTGDGKIQIHCLNTFNHANGDKSSSAFISTRTGVYFCSTCAISYSFQRFLTEVVHYPLEEALRIITDLKKDEAFLPKNDEYEKIVLTGSSELTKFVDECKARLNPYIPIVRDYLAARGLDYETLVKASVGYLPENSDENGNIFQLECLVFPYYINNKVVAVRGRTFEGRKGGIKNSRFVPYNVAFCKENIILCEGESDTLRMQQLIDKNNLNYTAVGVPSATFRQEFLRELEGVKKVVIIPQDDIPSQTFASMAQTIITKDLTKDCTILRLRFKSGDGGKDVCDWLFQHEENELVSRIPVTTTATRAKWNTQKEMLEADFEKIDWILPNFIGRGEKIIIGGEQKSMKTFFTMFLLRSAATGEAFLGVEKIKPLKPVKIMFVEEEGGKDRFALRIKQIFKNEDNSNIIYAHKLGLKLDTKNEFEGLEDKIREFNPDLLVLDPLQRMHLQNEDSASDMALIWDNIHELTRKFSNMSIIIVQHFRKGGSTANYWDSLRGSNRGAGEADIGIFIRKENDRMQHNTILSVRFDGRDANPFEEISNETDEFKVSVNTKLWEISLMKNAPISIEDMQQQGIPVTTTAQAVIYRALEKGHLNITELCERTHLTKQQVRSIMRQDNKTIFTQVNLKDTSGKNDFYYILIKNEESYTFTPSVKEKDA